MYQRYARSLIALLFVAGAGAGMLSNDAVAQDKAAGAAVAGKVVASRVDDLGQLVLDLDIGSAKGIKVGMSGTVLAGPSGDKPLLHGGFKIMRVVEAGRSIAKLPRSGVNKLGPTDTRVHVFVK